MADILGQNTTQGADTGGASYEMDTTQDRQALIDAHRRNVSLGLLAAGLGMMAASGGRPGQRRPGLGQVIGQGGLAGLETYEAGEQTTAQQELQRQNQRGLQAYRSAEIREKQAQIDSTNALRQTQADAEKERVRHDQIQEQFLGQQRDIQQQNANTNAYRASIENTRTGIEGAKAQAEYAPVGNDIIARFRGTNVEKLIPLLPPEVVSAMPKKDADAYAKEVTTAYTRMAKNPSLDIKFMAMGDGKVHKLVTDKTTGKTTDTPVGPAVIKSGKGSLADALKEVNAATGETAAGPAPEATPSPATETTNATPSGPPPAATPKLGKRLGAVDTTKYQNGKIYRDPKSGKRYIVKDGVMYEAA